jgi:hypothetical protein
MPALPFDPVDLAPVFPDVLWAIGIAFVLAFVTFRPPKPPTVEEAMAVMQITEVANVTDDEGDDGS